MSSDQLPVRDHMDDAGISWHHGKPDYSTVDKAYMKGKKMNHKAGSLEKIVENLVKTWEVESSHKAQAKDWQTVDREKFTISANGGRKFTLQDNLARGNIQLLMADCPLYDAAQETNDSSQDLFKKVFKNGFAWELLEVQTGPPLVSFTWRHWGKAEGPYRDTPPVGRTLEMFGSCVARMNEQQKIESIEVFFDPNPMMATLTGFKRPGGCPYSQGSKKGGSGSCTVL